MDNGFGLSWSLSTEFFFYLTYLVLVLHLIRLKKISSLLVTIGSMSIAVWALLLFAAGHQSGIFAFASQHLK